MLCIGDREIHKVGTSEVCTLPFDFRFVEYLNYFSKLQTVDLEQISCRIYRKLPRLGHNSGNV
jgi:hypothetical protein